MIFILKQSQQRLLKISPYSSLPFCMTLSSQVFSASFQKHTPLLSPPSGLALWGRCVPLVPPELLQLSSFSYILRGWSVSQSSRPLTSKWIWSVGIPNKGSEGRWKLSSCWLSSSVSHDIGWPDSLEKTSVSFFGSFLLGWSGVPEKAQLISS